MALGLKMDIKRRETSLVDSQGKGATFTSPVIGILLSGEPPGQDAY